MARNEEKAQSMLNRFLAFKNEEKKKGKEKRPYLASACRDLTDADKWRLQILREIGGKVMDIQNPGLGEHRLRDLNDEINKLIREKGHWEHRIVELGGPDHAKSAPRIKSDCRGMGYRYFGAAKQLPGVRELFKTPPESKKRRSRYEMYKCIDADYYGYKDEDNGALEPLEKEAEHKMRTKAVDEWIRIEAIKIVAKEGVRSGKVVILKPVFIDGNESVDAEEGSNDNEESKSKTREFVAHVSLPDPKEIERMVVEKKKQELLNKYTSEFFLQEQRETKELLHIQQ
ncbi:hypothetical protein L7F22_007596 [Adiantum nelumboides]|nr:hypothetical protein [Adiantum nelumboides]